MALLIGCLLPATLLAGCIERVELAVYDWSSRAEIRLALEKNGETESRVGLCHYKLSNGRLSAKTQIKKKLLFFKIFSGALSSISINTDGLAQGFYADYSDGKQIFNLYHENERNFRKPAVLKEGKKCGMDLPSLLHEGHNSTHLRRRRSDDPETLELIIVLSSGLLEQYGKKDATSKTEKVRPLLERYESVYKSRE